MANDKKREPNTQTEVPDLSAVTSLTVAFNADAERSARLSREALDHFGQYEESLKALSNLADHHCDEGEICDRVLIASIHDESRGPRSMFDLTLSERFQDGEQVILEYSRAEELRKRIEGVPDRLLKELAFLEKLEADLSEIGKGATPWRPTVTTAKDGLLAVISRAKKDIAADVEPYTRKINKSARWMLVDYVRRKTHGDPYLNQLAVLIECFDAKGVKTPDFGDIRIHSQAERLRQDHLRCAPTVAEKKALEGVFERLRTYRTKA